MEEMKSFKTLTAWKESFNLVLIIYDITKKFPKDELYILINQMRRASISVASNLAEGNSRYGKLDKIKFYNTSYSSLSEVHSQVLIAQALGYIDEKITTNLENQIILTKKLINGLIRKTKS